MGRAAKETEGVGSAMIQSAADRGDYCDATQIAAIDNAT
jgi:hypothetical protein